MSEDEDTRPAPGSAAAADAELQGIRDLAWAGLVWLITVLAFWPALAGVARATAAHEQLTHAFTVLVMATLFILRDRRDKPAFRFGKASIRGLFLSYGVMAGAIWLKQPVLALAACCFLVQAGFLFVYGQEVKRLAWSLVGTFAGFMLVILAFPAMDWPLRAGAARMAGWLLGLVGQDASLALAAPQGEPKLLLLVNDRVFEVAPECNGFGLISGSLMLALLLVLYRPMRWFDKLLSVAMAALLGFVVNAVRILAISLIAPHVGDNYHAMHEVVGTALFLGGLVLVWWLIWGLPVVTRKTGGG